VRTINCVDCGDPVIVLIKGASQKRCVECGDARKKRKVKEWKHANKDRVKEYAKTWRAKNRDKIREYNRHYQRRRRGKKKLEDAMED